MCQGKHEDFDTEMGCSPGYDDVGSDVNVELSLL
jgi:hypothetical protein